MFFEENDSLIAAVVAPAEIGTSKIFDLSQQSTTAPSPRTTCNALVNTAPAIIHRLVMVVGAACVLVVLCLSTTSSWEPKSPTILGVSDRRFSQQPGRNLNFESQRDSEQKNTLKVKVTIHGDLSGNEESLAYALSAALPKGVSPKSKPFNMMLVLVEEREDGTLSQPISIQVPGGMDGHEQAFLKDLIRKEKQNENPFPFLFETNALPMKVSRLAAP